MMSTIEQPRRYFPVLEFNQYKIESSETHTFSVEIQDRLDFCVYQNRQRPDHALRFWISEEPRNQGISWGGKTNYFNIKDRPYDVSLVDSSDRTLYSNLYTFLIPSNVQYFINIQNLENYPSGYKFFQKAIPDYCE